MSTKIFYISSEICPFAYTGDLGVFIKELPVCISSLGCEVNIVVPFYRKIKDKGIDKLEKRLMIQMGDRYVEAGLAKKQLTPTVTLFFVIQDDYFGREGLYGDQNGVYHDNAERYIFFSKAVVELLEERDVDIIHLNNWQTGLVATLLKTVESKNRCFSRTRTVFTIHNIAEQGIFWHYDMHLTNLSWEAFTPEGIEFYGNMNLLKAGIVYSDMITTTSQGQELKVQQREYGHGLDGVLKKRKHVLKGIDNGLDSVGWKKTAMEYDKIYRNLKEI